MTRTTSYLTTADFARLNQAATVITEALGHYPYLVGSVLEKDDFRDVDVRSVLPDEEWDELFAGKPFFWGLFCRGVTEILRSMTGLPIDYQAQRMTEANEKFDGIRNPIGTRARLYCGGGDATAFNGGEDPERQKGGRG